MAENSKIEWTDHTFNPWWGCAKVSPACENCYAELWAKRTGHEIWGATSPRRFLSDASWRAPIAWNEEARAQKTRKRVFCASMADVFEKRTELNSQRERLWTLIDKTPWLDWLLLTKRPENVEKMVPWTEGTWPKNVWLGTTVENQRYAEKRLPHLLRCDARVRFLSCEPLLGPVDLTPWIHRPGFKPIDWVIAGGESGPGARPMHPDWVDGILDTCRKAKIPFHFKQWGNWAPASDKLQSRKKTLIEISKERPVEMIRLPKKEAGRILAGRTWDGLPKTRVKTRADAKS